jgi:hypothetical protein
MGYQTFIFDLNSSQVAEGRCGYAGSNKRFPVERDSVRKKELLEPLSLFEWSAARGRTRSANARMPSTSSSSSWPE